MRLINTTSLELCKFWDSEIPEYAILSHTWGEGEVSYQDWIAPNFQQKKGYKKIHDFCKISRQDGYEWAWADTCCIDKSSSAELSEAINSMFRWYKESKSCYAYLTDVPGGQNGLVDAEMSDFSKSRWFSRGWTLQELIAPRHLTLYSVDWNVIGNKIGLSSVLEKVTGIPVNVIEDGDNLWQCCIAQKMSWASLRTTSRKEDIAYSLLGLFNINMPLLYGEGDKAFLRFQEEILKESDDHSLFAWTFPESWLRFPSGIFASSPSYFSRSGGIREAGLWQGRHLPLLEQYYHSDPYQITNRGLQIHIGLISKGLKRSGFGTTDHLVLAILRCFHVDREDCLIGIHLASLHPVTIESGPKKREFHRPYDESMVFVDNTQVDAASVHKIYVPKSSRHF